MRNSLSFMSICQHYSIIDIVYVYLHWHWFCCCVAAFLFVVFSFSLSCLIVSSHGFAVSLFHNNVRSLFACVLSTWYLPMLCAVPCCAMCVWRVCIAYVYQCVYRAPSRSTQTESTRPNVIRKAVLSISHRQNEKKNESLYCAVNSCSRRAREVIEIHKLNVKHWYIRLKKSNARIFHAHI